MRNPIFQADTMFLDQSIDSSFEYVRADPTIRLSCGATVERLKGRQALVKLETASGASITLSPETVFSLAKTPDGALIRYLPSDLSCREIADDFNWEEPFTGADDIRRYVLAGLVAASGTHSFDESRPSNIRIPQGNLTQEILPFLRLVASRAEEDGWCSRKVQVTARDVADRVFIKSRAITHVVGDLLEEKTQALAFDPFECDRTNLFAFFRGLLFAADREGNERSISYRTAGDISLISQALGQIFGVPSIIEAAPYTAERVSQKIGMLHHRLVLKRRMVGAAIHAGLIDAGPKETEFSITRYLHADNITKVVPLEKKVESVIVMPGEARKYPLTASTFVFLPAFAVTKDIEALASHPSLLDDSSDPASLLSSPLAL